MGSIFTGEISHKKIQEIEAKLENMVETTTILEGGKIKSSLLPSFVDDIHEFATFADFPAIEEAEEGVIYLDLSTNYQYRFSGSQYVNITSSIIHDEAKGDATTYSSNKIETLISQKTEIDDTSNTTNKTLSSQKIKADFQNKTITDEGGYFTATTVEGALQELGSALNGVETLLSEI